MNYLAFTLCSNNYLAQAVTLGKSLLKHNSDYAFKIGLVDRKIEEIDYSSLPFDVLEVEQVGIKSFNEMSLRYCITELNTAVKPFYFKYLFKTNEDIQSIIFLDPDITVYHQFKELEKALDENEIIITPHFTTPIDDDKFPSENDILNSGLYNLGFIALKKGSESGKLLDWWEKRLEFRGFIDFSKGLFTDQIWINFAPLFFGKVHILCNPGYNMAYWNLHERFLTKKNEVYFKGKYYPLVFFHFSGYDPLKPDVLSKYQNRFSMDSREDISQLFKDYIKKLFLTNYTNFIQYPCYYEAEKQKMDREAYLALKKSIPICKRIFRGIILRVIKILKIKIDYYTH